MAAMEVVFMDIAGRSRFIEIFCVEGVVYVFSRSCGGGGGSVGDVACQKYISVLDLFSSSRPL